MEKGKIIRTDDIRLSDEQDLKYIDESGYTYLGYWKLIKSKEKEMKEKFSKEYL